ncbi:MAG: hypothetical protein ACJA1P_002603, partial [Maribacter sp.]
MLDTSGHNMKDKSNKNPFYLSEERAFLDGPRNRFKELWFTFKVQYHFIRAFRKL